MSDDQAPVPLRDKILREATRLFARRGFAGASMRELMEACKCTKPAIYYHFGSKDELFRKVVDRQQAIMDGLAEVDLGHETSVRVHIHAAIDVFVQQAHLDPDGMLLLRRLETTPPESLPEGACDAIEKRHLEHLTGLFSQGIERGEIRGNVTAEDCAIIVHGVLKPRFHASIDTNVWDVTHMHRLIDLIFEGIAK